MAGRILFIDQLDDELMELKLSLEAKGIQVTVQPNPKRAIDDAKLNIPDLVVIEVLTRPVGGLEFASTIALGKYGFSAPVIFYTAFYRDERARRDITEKYGALHYFVKPFQREALRKAIFSVLEQSSHFRSETQPRGRSDAPSVLEQSSHSRSETQPRGQTDAPSVVEQSSHFRSETLPRGRSDAPSVLEQSSHSRSETQPRGRSDVPRVVEQSSYSRSETQPRSSTDAPSVLAQSSHSLDETEPRSWTDAPEKVLPFKPNDENEVVTHTPVSEPATLERPILVESALPEPSPVEDLKTSLELIKKEPEVEDEVKTQVPVAPVKVTTLKMYPKSPKVWAKDDKPKIQTPTMPAELKPSAPLRVDPKVSSKPKGAGTRTMLPTLPVKEKNWNWAMVALLIFVSVAALYWIWYRYGHSSPGLDSEPIFESNGSSSSDLHPSNSIPTPTKSSQESGPMVHEPAAVNSTKSPSGTPAQAKNPPKLPSETGKQTPGQNATPSLRPELIVSDVSISIREPQLVHLKKVAMSDDNFGEMGAETFVVRVVIDGKGKVREVTQLKKNSIGASLPQSVLDSIWDWEFRPVARREGQFFVKHYSFRVARP